jgi:hypothetical protein
MTLTLHLTHLRLQLIEAWNCPLKRKSLLDLRDREDFLHPFDQGVFDQLLIGETTCESFYKKHGRLSTIQLMELLNQYDTNEIKNKQRNR